MQHPGPSASCRILGEKRARGGTRLCLGLAILQQRGFGQTKQQTEEQEKWRWEQQVSSQRIGKTQASSTETLLRTAQAASSPLLRFIKKHYSKPTEKSTAPYQETSGAGGARGDAEGPSALGAAGAAGASGAAAGRGATRHREDPQRQPGIRHLLRTLRLRQRGCGDRCGEYGVDTGVRWQRARRGPQLFHPRPRLAMMDVPHTLLARFLVVYECVRACVSD